MKFCGTADALDGGEDFFVGAGDKDVVVGRFFGNHGADDFGYLRGSFTFAEDYFGVALAEGAVVVHLGEAEVLEGQMLQPGNGCFGGELAHFDGLQELQQFFRFHGVGPLGILTSPPRQS